nr:hypothetical protein CFP56_71346 [Quercus suber]
MLWRNRVACSQLCYWTAHSSIHSKTASPAGASLRFPNFISSLFHRAVDSERRKLVVEVLSLECGRSLLVVTFS